MRRICGLRSGKICTTLARENDLEIKIIKNWHDRNTFGSWRRQNLHHACAREGFGNQNRKKLTPSEHFWKLKSAKFAPRLRATTIWKSKSLKHQGLGPLFEVQSAYRVAGTGISIRFKMRGRRTSSWGLQKCYRGGGFEEARKRCVSRGRGEDFVLCDVDGWGLRRRIRGRAANFMSRKRYHFAWQLQDFVCLGSTFSWQAQYFWSIHLKIAKTYCNSGVKRAVNMSFLKEVSQKCFVFDVRSFILEGSLAQKLRFWASKLRFWRKSRRNASFLIFKVSFLKEFSQKSFVFELQSFIFEGSLAEMLRF